MSTKNANFAEKKLKIRENVDNCVKCALCLPHCPTYQLSREEGESPRGRLALMAAIADARLEPDGIAREHLDNCLDCRACEAVCPAQVAYGETLSLARETMREPARSSLQTLLIRAFTATRTQPLLAPLLRLLPRRGLAGMLRGLPQRLVRGMPPKLVTAPRAGQAIPASVAVRGRVALFLGCAARSLDGRSLQDSITLLTASGYDVEIPSQQDCCGALAGHAGAAARAKALAERNAQALRGFDAVIIAASGCAAHFHDLAERGDKRINTVEICQFLDAENSLGELEFEPLQARVTVHTPCTARNVLRDTTAASNLLRHIPGVTLRTPQIQTCCGAAGSYYLQHPETAHNLAQNVLDSIDLRATDFFCTSNYGCAMHLRGVLASRQRMEILHPVSLLARQLRGPRTG